MTVSKRGAAAFTVVLAASIGISSLSAQERPRAKPHAEAPQPVQPQKVTLSGTVVDLQCYMTEAYPGKNPRTFSRNCIRRGVPAALETDGGLIILGRAKGSPANLAQHAMRPVEVTGTLYVKHGVRYMEIASIKKLKNLSRETEQDEELEEEPEPEPEPEPDQPDEPNKP